MITGSTRQGLHRPWERPRPAAATSAAASPPPAACPLLCPRFTNTPHPVETWRGRLSGTPPLPSLAPCTRALPAANAGSRVPAGRAREDEEGSGRWEGGAPGRKEARREQRMLPRRPAPPPGRLANGAPRRGLRRRAGEGGRGRKRGSSSPAQWPLALPPSLPAFPLPPRARAAAPPAGTGARTPPYLQRHLLRSPVRAQPAQELQGALAIPGPLSLADGDVQFGHLRRAGRDVDVVGHDSGQNAARHGATRTGSSH